MDFVTGENISVCGTFFVGTVSIGFGQLCEIFGSPQSGDGYKTDAEWTISFADGTIANIYNWKDGRNYCGADGMDVADITQWYVGGHSGKALDHVHNTVLDYLNEKTEITDDSCCETGCESCANCDKGNTNLDLTLVGDDDEEATLTLQGRVYDLELRVAEIETVLDDLRFVLSRLN